MRRPGAVLVALLLTAGCSLPLPSGVRTPDRVRGQGRPAELQVLPQGPIAGQGQKEIVEGFLAAQASPTGDYAIARQFLTGEAARTWNPARGIRVYRPETEKVTLGPAGQGQQGQRQLTVSLDQLATVDEAGHYTSDPQAIAADAYGVTKVETGYRISQLPAWTGLQLSPIDLQRTYAIRNVYYLAPQPQQRPSDQRHLVPDRVLLPAGPDLAEELVRRLLDAPSTDLVGSVEEPSAPSLTPLSVEGSGIVTVTVSHDVDGLSPDEVRDLQAQLVWTLKQDERFTGLRLRTDSQVIRFDGESDVVPATAFASYDPNGLPSDPPYAFLTTGQSPGRLRSTAALTPSPLTTTDRLDSVAINPRADRIAALRQRAGEVDVLLGSAKSRNAPLAARARGLSSPTWGSGENGLWMLRGTDRVVRLDLASNRLQDVAVPARPAGPLRSLAVSRDGVRAALAIGDRVYVGHITWSPAGTASVVGLRPLDPTGGLRPVDTTGTPLQVVWATPTELVVLSRGQGSTRAVQRVSVDGSTAFAPIALPLLSPSSIAAAGQRILVAAGGQVFSAGLSAPVQKSGTSPVFPG